MTIRYAVVTHAGRTLSPIAQQAMDMIVSEAPGEAGLSTFPGA